ncbi:hypothetical protein [Candidatus Neptunochlamydia vexilliferae]|uniref:Uncharacterized protein n=1 Tax=Candidatus Neptunichlamydia vexilliferae TaxID=1651774 RepID=A0ABS0B0M2_9BACT|nr:hypothetical protein [Candidatus Neptunochlamydia vexilliferae]MBF5059943.1 hypothetical protein [Candidatus Neptunochlamydia vexilliferae]
MSVSSIDLENQAPLEEELNLSKSLEGLSVYIKNRYGPILATSGYRLKSGMRGLSLVLNFLFARMEKQGKGSIYEKVSQNITSLSTRRIVWSWNTNEFIKNFQALSREKHHISRQDLKEVSINILRSAYDDIPSFCCDYCSDSRLETIRTSLIGISFFLGNENFDKEVDRTVEEMRNYFTSKVVLTPNRMRHQQIVVRAYIQRLLEKLENE